MKTLTIICILSFFMACININQDKQAEEDKIQIVLERILKDDMTLDEKIEFLNSHTLDSLPFERKKAFIIKFTTQYGWETDSTYTEHERDSIMMNSEMKDYLRLIWHFEELSKCTPE